MYQGKQQFDELQAETLRKATNPVEKHKVCARGRLLKLQIVLSMCADIFISRMGPFLKPKVHHYL